MNFRRLFLTIFMGFGCVSAVKAAASLPAKPVVFVDFGPLWLQEEPPRITSKFHEMADIQNRFYELLYTHHNQADFLLLMPQLRTQLQDFIKRLHALTQSIAKRLGACAVIPLPWAQERYRGEVELSQNRNAYMRWVDPAYDITKEVIDTLNKEYDAKHF